MAKKDWKRKQELQDLCKAVIEIRDTDDLVTAKDFLIDLMKYKKLEKLDKTFIQGPLKAMDYNQEDRIFCDFNLDGTVTGRLSCTKCPGNGDQDMGISFHTLAKKDKKLDINIREAYVAEPGHIFLASDYSTMELRVLAQIANVKAMKEAFIRGEDLHTDTASRIFGLPKESIAKDSKERNYAKTANFLIVYGGQASNLAESVVIPLKTAQMIIDRLHSIYPEIERATNKCVEDLLEFGYVESIFGRRRRFPDIHSPITSVRNGCIRGAFNTLVQGPASDILLCADEGIRQDFIKHKIKRSRTLANVHDSYEASVHPDELEDVIYIVYDNMKNNRVFRSLGIEFEVPLEVELELGNSFGSGAVVHFNDGKITNLDEVKHGLKIYS